MTSAEIIDFSLRIYQALGWPILRATALPATFSFAGFAFLFFILIPRLEVTNSPTNMGAQVLEAALALLIALCVAIPIIMFGFSFATGTIVKIIADYIEGVVPDLPSAIRTARSSLKRLIALIFYESIVATSGLFASVGLLLLSAYIDSLQRAESPAVSGIVAVIAFFGFMVAGIIFLVVLSRHALTPSLVTLEGLRPRAAAKRSVQLLRGTSSHPNGYGTMWTSFFLIFLVAMALMPAFGFGMGLLDLQERADSLGGIPILGQAIAVAVSMLPLYALLWVGIPIWSVTTTILYFERRVRLEGYDIESLARDMVRKRKDVRFEL